MWLQKAAAFFQYVSCPLARILNYIAGLVLFLLMILTGIDVSFRYLLNSPIPGSFEITEYFLTVVIAFGLAQCALEKGHVSVDLVVSGLSSRKRAFMDSIAHLSFAALYAIICWQSLLRALGMKHTGLTTEVLDLLVYPFVLAVTLGCAVLCLVALKDFFQSLFEAFK
ncbi:MAG: TRAP transporter small permease [Deltaproteobacteria bacterium]|nr:TRAP transporter small permease [Deltaproteobacteria bacterium]